MNIVDALFVEIGIDRTKFDSTKRDSLAEMDHLQRGMTAYATQIEESVKKSVSESLRTVERHFLAFSAVLLSANSIREFTSNVTSAEVQLGILSAQLGATVPAISAFQMAVERSGGTATSAAAALTTLNRMVLGFTLEGQAAPNSFYRLGGLSIDSKAPPTTQIIQFSEAIARSKGDDQQKMFMLTQELGFDAAVAKLLLQPDILKGLVAESAQDAMTPGQAAAGTRFNAAWAAMSQAVQSTGWAMLEAVQGPLTDLLERLYAWLEEHKQWIAGWFAREVAKFSMWVESIDWAKVGKTLRSVSDTVLEIVKGIGGWKAATVDFVALWLALEVAPIMSVGVALASMTDPLGDVLAGLAAVLVVYKALQGSPAAASTTSAPAGEPIQLPGARDPAPAGTKYPAPAGPWNWPSGEPNKDGSSTATKIATSEGAVNTGNPVPVTLEMPDTPLWQIIEQGFRALGFSTEGSAATGGSGSGIGRSGPASSIGAVGSLPSGDLYARFMQLAMADGLTEKEAAALAGQATAESMLGTMQGGRVLGVGTGDSGLASGMAQWHSDRWNKLVAWARGMGLDPSKWDTQVRMMAHEYSAEWRARLGAAIERARTPEELERASAQYESFAGWQFHSRASAVAGTRKALERKRDELTGSHLPYVAPTKPAADGAASAARSSMLMTHHNYEVARLDVHAHGLRGDGVAREVRLALERELANLRAA